MGFVAPRDLSQSGYSVKRSCFSDLPNLSWLSINQPSPATTAESGQRRREESIQVKCSSHNSSAKINCLQLLLTCEHNSTGENSSSNLENRPSPFSYSPFPLQITTAAQLLHRPRQTSPTLELHKIFKPPEKLQHSALAELRTPWQ